MRPGQSWSRVGFALALICAACGDDHRISAVPPATLHRLSVPQYQNTVRALLGDDVVVPPIEPDIKLHGFTSIATGELTVSPVALEQYEIAAIELARQVISNPDRRESVVGCATPDEECISQFFTRFGRRAWRRPLTEAEVGRITAVVAQAADALSGDRWRGVEFGIALVLQAPDFLYRIEIGVGTDKRRKLTGYEMASRLAFVLTETGPDDALLDAAAAGELDRADGVRRHAIALLDQPRGRDALARFFGEYLNLERLGEVSKDGALFPQMTDALKLGMAAEVLWLFEYVVFDADTNYREIFTTDQTFVTKELAAFYGVEPPRPDEGPIAQRTLPADSPRGGLLGAAALLAIYADNASTSPTRRGRFVRQNLLCEDVPPPPPGVDTNFADNTGATVRERVAMHSNNASCAGCHSLMDPIGLGFERFDAIGQARIEEAPGIPVDDRGELDGIAFTGVRELGALLANDPRVAPCFVTQFYRFATGHLELPLERDNIEELSQSFAASGFRVRELALQLVTSDAFRYVGGAVGGFEEEMP